MKFPPAGSRTRLSLIGAPDALRGPLPDREFLLLGQTVQGDRDTLRQDRQELPRGISTDRRTLLVQLTTGPGIAWEAADFGEPTFAVGGISQDFDADQ